VRENSDRRGQTNRGDRYRKYYYCGQEERKDSFPTQRRKKEYPVLEITEGKKRERFGAQAQEGEFLTRLNGGARHIGQDGKRISKETCRLRSIEKRTGSRASKTYCRATRKKMLPSSARKRRRETSVPKKRKPRTIDQEKPSLAKSLHQRWALSRSRKGIVLNRKGRKGEGVGDTSSMIKKTRSRRSEK